MERTIFTAMAKALLRLASSETKREGMARLNECNAILRELEGRLTMVAVNADRLASALVGRLGGKVLQVSVNLPAGPCKSIRFIDATGASVIVIDPHRSLLLIEPDHVSPITAELSMVDGSIQTQQIDLPEAVKPVSEPVVLQ